MKFIVPQNFKNGRLIMKRYRLFDLVMLISVVGFSLVVFIAVVQSGIGRNGIIFFFAFFSILIFITFILTMGAGINHNILELILTIKDYYKTEKKYEWAGRIYADEESFKKEQR